MLQAGADTIQHHVIAPTDSSKRYCKKTSWNSAPPSPPPRDHRPALHDCGSTKGPIGHKGGLLKRTDVHHRLSYKHKFFTSVHACAVQSHRLHVSPSWLGCSTIYVHYQKNQGAWQTHVCHVTVCMGYPIAGEVPRASVEAPWTPASLVPGSNPAARAARSGSSGAAARAKASNGWGGSLPSGVGGGGAHCCRRLGTFF